MNFEQEVQALVNKYGIEDVEITYRKKLVLNSKQTYAQTTLQPTAIRSDEATDMDEDPTLRAYLGGNTSKLGS